MRFIRVDLPHPDGPTMVRNSRSRTCRFVSSSASTRRPLVRKTWPTRTDRDHDVGGRRLRAASTVGTAQAQPARRSRMTGHLAVFAIAARTRTSVENRRPAVKHVHCRRWRFRPAHGAGAPCAIALCARLHASSPDITMARKGASNSPVAEGGKVQMKRAIPARSPPAPRRSPIRRNLGRAAAAGGDPAHLRASSRAASARDAGCLPLARAAPTTSTGSRRTSCKPTARSTASRTTSARRGGSTAM